MKVNLPGSKKDVVDSRSSFGHKLKAAFLDLFDFAKRKHNVLTNKLTKAIANQGSEDFL